jgi:hypothetical protein
VAKSSRNSDLNSDGTANRQDVALVLPHFGANSAALPDEGDLDSDGDIDLFDLFLFQVGITPSANSPEANSPTANFPTASVPNAASSAALISAVATDQRPSSEAKTRLPAARLARRASGLAAHRVDAAIADFSEPTASGSRVPVLRARRTSRPTAVEYTTRSASLLTVSNSN